MTDKVPIDAFAYEVLHGAHLTEELFAAVAASATNVLRERYPKLGRAIAQTESALADLYQIAGEVWHEEAKRAEHAS
jgi:hypothetical protein